MTPQQLTESLQIIRSAMDEQAGLDNPTGVAEKLQKLSTLLGLSAECQAWARRFYDEKIGRLSQLQVCKGMSATDKKVYIGLEASQEAYQLNYAEGLNKDCHYVVESCRSMLSFLKQEMAQIQKG